VLQCTSEYPTPPERVGLNVMAELSARYGCEVGLSDHSGTVWAGVAAAALGATVLEVHVTFSRQAFGPDVPASVTVDELADLVAGVRFVTAALDHPVDKDGLAEDLAPVRGLFTRSVVARHDLAAGAVLTAADLAAKKPGTGIPAARLPELVGRRLARAVAADQLLADADLEPAP
jgi:N,N'-diacetyllegionaminate synthase